MSIEYTTARAMDYLTRVLCLPARGDEQDWEIELADAGRLDEFLDRYFDFAGDDEYAFAMAALIIASFDNLVALRLNSFDKEYFELFQDAGHDIREIYSAEELRLWRRISLILKTRPDLFANHIRYWAQMEEEHSGFACSLLFRNQTL
ncbi:hypothetical protein [Roseibium sediminicola]|uniref:Uncharacterized protein n=1 Tax=Roseibium sediminicola TaxID=2933272 RepID=A0ABT0GU18_9HYPH|nr:hypothetical protein [Roseibium sp. CAU 1639]MCK7612936.1 hypothetical protein [Roseibium sp. CAU 1639]